MLTGKVGAALPAAAQDVTVNLEGFGLLQGAGRTLEYKNQVSFCACYTLPDDAEQPQEQRMTLTGAFCMFCGEKYSLDHAPAFVAGQLA